MLDSRRNSFIAAVSLEGGRAGIAYADLSTGEFAATELVEKSLEEAPSRRKPRADATWRGRSRAADRAEQFRVGGCRELAAARHDDQPTWIPGIGNWTALRKRS